MKIFVPALILLTAICLFLSMRQRVGSLSTGSSRFEEHGELGKGEQSVGEGSSTKPPTKSRAILRSKEPSRPHTRDMSLYFSDIRELIQAGDYAEALDRHLWFHEHALDYDEAMTGVRLSFALGSWFELGEKYQPAKDALIGTRDRDLEVLKNGGGDERLFYDVLCLNETLGEKDNNIKLFEQIQKSRPDDVKDYWRFIKDTVLEAKRYDIAADFIGEPAADFKEALKFYDENQSLYDDPRLEGEQFRAYNENSFVEQSLALIDMATALGKNESAKEMRAKAFAVVGDPRLADHAMVAPE